MAKGNNQKPANGSNRKADLVPVWKDLANPPFNLSDWGGENLRQDVRFFSLSASNDVLRSREREKVAQPDEGHVGKTIPNERTGVRCRIHSSPVNNANYAWIQHFIHHLSPAGVAGFVLANGSMSTQTLNEGEVRKAMIEADLVDCMVALAS
jgi:type I restriction enzyme M protein